MYPLAKIEPARRRRVYVLNWTVAIGGHFAGGRVVARTVSAMGRRIYVIVFPCGTTRHLAIHH